MRIAFFGGSFDPPHMAHVQCIAVALASGEVDGVLAVPCFQHVFGKDSTPYAHRIEMVKRALQIFGKRVEVSDIEEQLAGPSRTLDTLQALMEVRPADSWRLLIGTDILAEKDKWHRFDEIARLAPPLIVGRSGWEATADTDFALPAISSSDIRNRLKTEQNLGHLVPASVLQYIQKEGLYELNK
jgi:nicotinate-nucleotide adenylyltransferase